MNQLKKQTSLELKPKVHHEINGWDVLDRLLQTILMRVMSGRWIATVIICGAFAHMMMQGKIDQKDVVLVVMTVIAYYFGMKVRDEGKKTTPKDDSKA